MMNKHTAIGHSFSGFSYFFVLITYAETEEYLVYHVLAGFFSRPITVHNWFHLDASIQFCISPQVCVNQSEGSVDFVVNALGLLLSLKPMK